MSGKLGAHFRGVNLYATLAFSLFSLACIHPPRTVTTIGDATWTSTVGNPQRTPFLAERVPADPAQQWQERYGRGYTDVPFVSSDLLIASSTAKTVSVANPATGRRFWERRLDGGIIGAVLRKNDRLYAATQSRDGHVDALYLDRGRHAWNFRLHAPAVGGPVIIDSTMYIGSERAELFALGIANGQLEWRVRIPGPLATAPVGWGSSLVLVTAADSLMLADRSNGATHPGIRLSGSVSAPIAITGDRLLIATQPGALQAIHLPDLRVEWSASLGAPILAAPAIDSNGDVYALARDATVWRIDGKGSATRIAQLGGAAAASLTLTADGLLVGKLDGSLHMLRRDGTEMWARAFTHSLRSPVAVNGGALFVTLGDGHLVMMR